MLTHYSFCFDMKKTYIYIGLLVLVICGWWLLQKPETTSSQTIKIGSILPLTGDFAFFGSEINRGAQIALEEAKAQGVDAELIVEDDKSQATGAVNAANKLVHSDKVSAVITATLQEVKPIAPIFNENKVPLLATWDSNTFIKTAGDYIFTIGFSTEDAGQKMAAYAYNGLGLHKVAVVSALDEWSEIIAEAFKAKFSALGGTVTIHEKVQPSQKEFKTVNAKVKDAEGIYFPLLPTTIAPFLIQASQLGVKAKLMTGDSFSMDEVTAARGAAEGVIFSNLYADQVKGLSQKYKQKFGEDPADPIFVSFGYDGIKAILEGVTIAKAKGISLRDALTQVDFQGTDSRIKMNGGQFFEKKERLYQVRGGQFVELK